ncbi:MAG: NAD(+)/NADH kinase [Candidatus Peribacteraceae bacterium]|nr:NAD(+)/NADH kinase [Candidatus Peribacteraceae bacterium]
MKVHFISNERHGIPVPVGIEETDMVNADIVVVYGGDGTILRTFGAMSLFGMFNIPILGINKGTVGFMANDVVENGGDAFRMLITSTIKKFWKEPNHHIFERRSLLDVTLDDRNDRIVVLNEITVHPKDLGKLLDVEVGIQSLHDSSSVPMKGDGVIVSTPTGSTAYNLSAGGPILMPHMDAMVVTPLNPFTMAGRSIVLSKDDNITLKLNDPARVVVDGTEINNASTVNISFSKDKMILVRANSFFDALQTKLGWHRPIK